jgi:hypothetical protein
MTVRRSPGAWRQLTSASGVNIIDNNAAFSGTVDQRTLGATIIDLLTLPGQAYKPWKVIGFSVTAGIRYIQDGPAGAIRQYGRLGQILVGLAVETPTWTQGAAPSQCWVNPMLELPVDSTVLTPLFDPSVNDMPPVVFSNNVISQPAAPLSVVNILPQPIDLTDYASAGMGIWIKPGLIPCSQGLAIFNAKWSLIYDDAS